MLVRRRGYRLDGQGEGKICISIIICIYWDDMGLVEGDDGSCRRGGV